MSGIIDNILVNKKVYAFIKIGNTHYPAAISIDKYNDTDKVVITISSTYSVDPARNDLIDSMLEKVEITTAMTDLVELSKEILKLNGVVISEQPAMIHFLALMEGLEIPHPEWWITQPPEMLKAVAGCVVKQAKGMYVNEKPYVDKEHMEGTKNEKEELKEKNKEK